MARRRASVACCWLRCGATNTCASKPRLVHWRQLFADPQLLLVFAARQRPAGRSAVAGCSHHCAAAARQHGLQSLPAQPPSGACQPCLFCPSAHVSPTACRKSRTRALRLRASLMFIWTRSLPPRGALMPCMQPCLELVMMVIDLSMCSQPTQSGMLELSLLTLLCEWVHQCPQVCARACACSGLLLRLLTRSVKSRLWTWSSPSSTSFPISFLWYAPLLSGSAAPESRDHLTASLSSVTADVAAGAFALDSRSGHPGHCTVAGAGCHLRGTAKGQGRGGCGGCGCLARVQAARPGPRRRAAVSVAGRAARSHHQAGRTGQVQGQPRPAPVRIFHLRAACSNRLLVCAGSQWSLTAPTSLYRCGTPTRSPSLPNLRKTRKSGRRPKSGSEAPPCRRPHSMPVEPAA